MKNAVKALANLLSKIAVLPVVGLYLLGSLCVGREKAFPGWSQAMSLLPGLCGVYLRRGFYRLVLDRCDRDACISFGTIFSHPTACVGRSVYIGPYCVIGSVTLEDDVLISSHVSIINGSRQHGTARLDVPIREQPGYLEPVTIGADTWIGERTVVQANIGRQCVIGSGAVVTEAIPDRAVARGVPAKVVRFRDPGEPCPENPLEDAASA